MKKFSDLIERFARDSTETSKDILKGKFQIMKSDKEKMLAFGWENVSIRVDGELLEDWQGDMIEPEELKAAA